MAHITQTVVQKAEITDKIYYIWDDQITGFGLKVIPNGKKKFVLRYYHCAGGKMQSSVFICLANHLYDSANSQRKSRRAITEG